MTISIIVAISQNRVIGNKNQLPWHLPEDLKRFKTITMGHAIVMGRKTFESIGRPLPGRKSIVVSRNPDYAAEGITVIHSLKEIIEQKEDGGRRKEASKETNDEVFIIGGAEIFKCALPQVDKIYLTMIHKEFEGDTFFPELDLEKDFNIIEESKVYHSKNFDLPYQYITAIRK